MEDAMIRTRVDSSSIESVTYDPSDGAFEVNFRRTGHCYRYFDVPQDIFNAFMKAESKGTYLNQVIKSTFEYTRVDFPL
jgi:hypothetical protein